MDLDFDAGIGGRFLFLELRRRGRDWSKDGDRFAAKKRKAFNGTKQRRNALRFAQMELLKCCDKEHLKNGACLSHKKR
jgi:hypothetical protein